MMDYLIVGAGFAGQYAAILLKQAGLTCEIIDGGSGASNFWAGTLDVLKTQPTDVSFENAFSQFQQKFPTHPYNHVKFSELELIFSKFHELFPEIRPPQTLENSLVFSSLGTLKPCIGAWKTIFPVQSLENVSDPIILINFEDFSTSSMHLVQKSIQEKFNITPIIVDVKLRDVFPALMKLDKISAFQIGKAFDNLNDSIIKVFQERIHIALGKNGISHLGGIVFPPILGINHNFKVVKMLEDQLGSPIWELISLSPSLMANRLLHSFQNHVQQLKIPVHKGHTFIQSELFENAYISTIESNRKPTTYKDLKSKGIIFATGSLFQKGGFSDIEKINTMQETSQITLQFRDLRSFELINNLNRDKPSNIYIIGSQSYTICENITDDDEINHCTGLGLAIITASKAVSSIIKKKLIL